MIEWLIAGTLEAWFEVEGRQGSFPSGANGVVTTVEPRQNKRLSGRAETRRRQHQSHRPRDEAHETAKHAHTQATSIQYSRHCFASLTATLAPTSISTPPHTLSLEAPTGPSPHAYRPPWRRLSSNGLRSSRKLSQSGTHVPPRSHPFHPLIGSVQAEQQAQSPRGRDRRPHYRPLRWRACIDYPPPYTNSPN